MTTAFRYRASTASGDEVRGVLRATSARAAIDELRRQSLVPVEVEPAAEGARARGTKFASPWRVSVEEGRAVAIRTIATLIGGGATIDRALAFAAEHAEHPEVKRAVASLRGSVRDGEALSAALRREERLFGSLAAAVARAGEESGTLDDGLSQLADHFDRARELRATVQQALWYPALMGIVAGIGVTVLLLFVVPRFVQMLGETGGSFPTSTRMLIAVSGAVRRWWWVIGALIAGGWGWGRHWLRDEGNVRRWHAVRLEWPVVGSLDRGICTARFARAFGTLLRGGVGALSALRISLAAVPNVYVRQRLSEAASGVARGESLARALDGIFPPLATQLLSVGEESGGGALGAMALRVAESYERDTQRALRALVALIEPLLIVVFGGVVGFVALAMLQAVYAINGGLA